jgi:hypothetical protein
MEVCIQTKYLGAQWAGKILADWHCSVSFEGPSETAGILITD